MNVPSAAIYAVCEHIMNDKNIMNHIELSEKYEKFKEKFYRRRLARIQMRFLHT